MFDDDPIDRRTILKRAGAATLASVALAGCSGDGDDGGNGNGNGTTEGGNGNGDGTSGFGGWLDGANNYDGTVEDMTGSDTVTVEVGAGDTGLAFGPAAVQISTGTTIEWEWTGVGGGHNVHAQEGASFESDTHTESGVHFTHTFEEAETVTYQCDPHQTVMKGAVVVA
ncbi:MAG: halocyanin domain-containing protein [Halobacteriales archaeon]